MFLAILLLIFAIGCGALLIAVLTAGIDPTQWWMYLVLGLTSLGSLIGGLYKLEDETFCFSNLADWLSKRAEAKTERVSSGNSGRQASVKKEKPKPEKNPKPKKSPQPIASIANVKLNIILGTVMALLLVAYIWLFFWITDIVYEDRIMRNIWQYFDIIGIFVSIGLFYYAGAILSLPDFDSPVFAGFHPVGRKISEASMFVEKVYIERGYKRAIKRVGLIFCGIYLLIIAVACFINLYGLTLLVSAPAFLATGLDFYDESSTYKDYIRHKSKCEDWEKFVCVCGTLVPGSRYVGRANERETEDRYRETTTTTTTTTIGDTTYVDTDVDTEYYRVTHYSYDDVYICPNCGRKVSVYNSGSMRTYE